MKDRLGLLVLTMHQDERVVMRDGTGRVVASFTVSKTGWHGNKTRIAIAAPADIVIEREDRGSDLKDRGQGQA